MTNDPNRAKSIHMLTRGALFFAAGVVVTVISFSMSTDGHFFVFWGLPLIGMIRMVQGLVLLSKKSYSTPPATAWAAEVNRYQSTQAPSPGQTSYGQPGYDAPASGAPAYNRTPYTQPGYIPPPVYNPTGYPTYQPPTPPPPMPPPPPAGFGAPAFGPPSFGGPYTPSPEYTTPAQKPASHLVWSILSMLLFLPTGIFATLSASRVNALWSTGDAHGASQASTRAKRFSLASAGVAATLLAIVLVSLIPLGSASSPTAISLAQPGTVLSPLPTAPAPLTTTQTPGAQDQPLEIVPPNASTTAPSSAPGMVAPAPSPNPSTPAPTSPPALTPADLTPKALPQMPASGSALLLHSTGQSFIAKGHDFSFLPAQGAILQGEGSAGTFNLIVKGPGQAGNTSDEFWTVELRAPQNKRFVAGQTYLHAVRTAPTPPGSGVDVSGDGAGCNQEKGGFHVSSVKYAADGTISSMSAYLVSACEGIMPPVQVQFRWSK